MSNRGRWRFRRVQIDVSKFASMAATTTAADNTKAKNLYIIPSSNVVENQLMASPEMKNVVRAPMRIGATSSRSYPPSSTEQERKRIRSIGYHEVPSPAPEILKRTSFVRLIKG
ncbi:hypothetical protein HAX54_002431 [Datura stramonium]|uniref:Uncharacterized protein n=1 Tax=Datura stramonium TaxID=4076 RepID=A0ABS8T5F9_DATST|nr:hypothetical protein [Datura stramonium]